MRENILISKNEDAIFRKQEKGRERAETAELTEEEKRAIDSALKTENVFDLFPSLLSDYLSDEKIKKIIDAQYKILSFGPRALDYLKNKLLDSKPYIFSVFASNMADESNFETVMNSLTHDSVTKIRDGSAASRLYSVFDF